MDNQDNVQSNVQKFNELMAQEENSNNDFITSKYNSSNINFNIALSQPNLNVSNSMDMNIKNNNIDNVNNVNNINNNNQITTNPVNSINQQSKPMQDNILSSNSYEKNNSTTVVGNPQIVNEQIDNIDIEEKKDLIEPNLNQNKIMNNYNSVNNIQINKKNNKVQLNYRKNKYIDNSELKFILLITLIMLIIIMFFPNIRLFFYDLFNN